MRAMSERCRFAHVGMTVKSISDTIGFYSRYFGFKVIEQGSFPPGFFDMKLQLYRVEGLMSDYAFIESPDGVVIELFEFSPQTEFKDAVWNTPGYHHICLYVKDLEECYKEMKADGLDVNYFFAPEAMDPKGVHHWVFLKDPDGNMIELQD